MMSAMNCNDYAYINHSGKRVCFKYDFKKRVRTKVTNFLKENHEEAKIIKFLNDLGLELINTSNSNRYKNYDIVEKRI